MIKVVHCKVEKDCEYIGRPNPLGNPFSHKEGTIAKYKVDTREEAVAAYRKWIIQKIKDRDKDVINELRRLKKIAMNGDLKLGCWCSPKECHGDVVKELIEKSIENTMKKQSEKK